MDINYDLLAEKLKEKLLGSPKPKVLTGKAYFRALRKEKNKLEENYIAPESGAPLVTQSEYETLIKLGIKGRKCIDPRFH